MRDPSPSAAIKPEVRGLTAYTLRHFEAEVKLDQNENQYELPPELKRQVVDYVLRRPWGRYPEFVPAAVIKALSKFTDWPEDGILVGNGSNELIQASLNVTLGPGRSLVVPQPTFTLYKLMATTLQSEVKSILLDPENLTFDVDKIIEASRIANVVVVCSPNNPTGGILEREALVRLLKNAAGLVLVDEAYHEFSGQTALSLLPEHQNLVVLRTFSKAMAMAGLRFGYMMADPEIAGAVFEWQLPYNCNDVRFVGVDIVIENRVVPNSGIEALVRERDRLFTELQKRAGVRAFPSTVNFILIRTARPARELFDQLYSHGVLVRDVSAYPLLDRCLRVSVGTPEENGRFLEALDSVLEKE